MNLLEYLDRRHARSLHSKPLDTKLIVGFAFLAAYYALIFYLASRPKALANADLVKDSLLILGPAVGLIIGALFRTDARDEQQTQNTARAFRAIEAASAAGSTTAAETVNVDAGTVNVEGRK